MEINEKLKNLENYIKKLQTAVVTFSAGVDSSFLLYVAHKILKDNVIAITVNINSFPDRELNEAIDFCQKYSIKHKIIEFNELEIDGFAKNPINRCYICKKSIFSKIKDYAQTLKITNILEGSNVDDKSDYRPGAQAVKELQIKSPLFDCGLTKNDIRLLSENLGLSVWNKPSFACLSSRIPYGDVITKEKLLMVDNSEYFLSALGFSQYRVRVHGNVARIEVCQNEFDKLIQNRELITDKLKKYGFSYVAMDLTGYRTGSLNSNIVQNQ